MDKLKQLNKWKEYIIKKKFLHYINECITDYKYIGTYPCIIKFEYVSEVEVTLLQNKEKQNDKKEKVQIE